MSRFQIISFKNDNGITCDFDGERRRLLMSQLSDYSTQENDILQRRPRRAYETRIDFAGGQRGMLGLTNQMN